VTVIAHLFRNHNINKDEKNQNSLVSLCPSVGLCKVYGRNALEVKSALVAARPDITVVLNPLKPRRNSFEITWMDGDKEKILWTGIKKGPPRKLKFPEASVVVAALEEALKSE
uniref:Selenoprotein H n=1 Tax=Neogobius melanostomus TaxID=47308 RepID=A0A8C6TMG9_9GOBI